LLTRRSLISPVVARTCDDVFHGRFPPNLPLITRDLPHPIPNRPLFAQSLGVSACLSGPGYEGIRFAGAKRIPMVRLADRKRLSVEFGSLCLRTASSSSPILCPMFGGSPEQRKRGFAVERLPIVLMEKAAPLHDGGVVGWGSQGRGLSFVPKPAWRINNIEMHPTCSFGGRHNRAT
jgi:hypothetical protein